MIRRMNHGRDGAGDEPDRQDDRGPVRTDPGCLPTSANVSRSDPDPRRRDRRRGAWRSSGGDGLQEISHPAAAGYDGTGGTVALLDTGVDYTRPEFGSCAKPGKGCQVIAAVDIAPPDGQADDSGHGTWTAAILASVAPAAKIISTPSHTMTAG